MCDARQLIPRTPFSALFSSTTTFSPTNSAISNMSKSVLVTGCSDGGLGAALAIAFHSAGCRVLASVRNISKASEIKAAGIEVVMLDIESSESLQICVAKVEELTGGVLDILVNNAGRGYAMPVSDIDLPSFRKFFDVNFFGHIAVTQAFLPLLLKANHGALIVNNTSINSMVGFPFEGAYNASKAALAAITETMRIEFEPFNIKVVDMKTGAVASNIGKNQILASNSMVPENSLWREGRQLLNAAFSGQDAGLQVDKMPSHRWANYVVRKLLNKNPSPHLWSGSYSTSVWFVVTFLPVGFLDRYIRRIYGFKNLFPCNSSTDLE